MRIRELEPEDLDALSDFITSSYDDYPLAMWFNAKPAREDVERIFYNKINGVGSRLLTDLVAEDKGAIVGECEVVRTYTDSGVVGILVKKEMTGKKIGTKLLTQALEAGKKIGIRKIRAEVMEENKKALKFFITNGFMPIATRRIEKSGKEKDIAILEMTVR